MAESRIAAKMRLASRFAAAGIESFDLDARLLVCAAVGIDHAELIRDPDLPMTSRQAAMLEGFEGRRLAREPISRIFGHREFWGLNFAISPAVLDPRPETEGLVGAVLDAIGGRRAGPLRILDLGVGSGAILAALLHELPGAFGVGIDRSLAACRVALDNIERLALASRAVVLCGNWSDPIAERFDVVVSNPPYIAAHEFADLSPEVRDHDPHGALGGGPDGLDAYRIIAPGLENLVAADGTVAFECGAKQGGAVANLLRHAGLADVGTYRDLSGHDRVVIGRRGD